MKASKFLSAIPIIVIIFSLFSFRPNSHDKNKQFEIGEINWEGNTKYSNKFLSDYLNIKVGDKYDRSTIESQFAYNPEGKCLADLYMDSGHLYFTVNLKDTIVNDLAILNFEVYEGITVVVDKIIIKGNENVVTNKILAMIEINQGELFNRTKLISSQRNIAKRGFFVEDNVNINPIPHDNFKLVDIEFTVSELE